MSNKHKHFDMIVAKAESMELVRFTKLDDNVGCEWAVQADAVQKSTQFNEKYEYFLCLPQHKEACLHWLNGGDVQDFFEEEWSDCASLAHATEVGGDNTLEFSMHHMFMNEEFNFRIAPKKEKRWIICSTKHEDVNETLFSKKPDMNSLGIWCQCIEIEVEVKE